jgi:hypothetical protein
MTKRPWLAATALLLALAGCNKSGSPVSGNDIVHAEGSNELDANTAASVYGPEGNATNATTAALGNDQGNTPDYDVSALDARPEGERGNLGGRPDD